MFDWALMLAGKQTPLVQKLKDIIQTQPNGRHTQGKARERPGLPCLLRGNHTHHCFINMSYYHCLLGFVEASLHGHD